MLLHKHVGTKSRAAAALLSLGMLMGEEYEGTTSTALCLREQSVVELFGAEHLIREEEDLCCISAPIFGGKRRMLGVLTIALPLELYHLHTSGMVLMAAKDISDQHHLHDLLSDQEAILEQVDTGIVVLDKNGGIKAANCTGRSMLHISPPPAPLGNINDVLGNAESLLMMIQSRKNIRDRECFFNLTDGGDLYVLQHHRRVPQPAEGHRTQQGRLAQQHHDPHPRGERHRQGTVRPCHPQCQRPQECAFCGRQLRRPAPRPHPERAVRL